MHHNHLLIDKATDDDKKKLNQNWIRIKKNSAKTRKFY